MAFDKDTEAKLEDVIKAQLQTQFNRGIRVGMLSAYKIVLDKVNDTSKPLMKRIEDVKKICQIADGKLKEYGYGDVQPEPSEKSADNDEKPSENAENTTVQKIEQSQEPKD